MKSAARGGVGDGEFLGRLYEQYGPLMFGAVYEFEVTRAEAEDIVSQTLLSLMRNLDTLRGLEEKALSAYIYTSARRTAIIHLNREALRCRREAEAARLSAPHAPEPFAGDTGQVLRALGRLSARERACITLKYVMGKTCAEIARETGLSESGVRKLLSRGRKHLKQALKEEEGEDE